MTQRLRRWIAPSDDDHSDTLPYHLDEQEQEQVITSLRTQNTQSNDLFKQFFAILSLIPTIVFIILPSHMSLLAITSLALTAYTAYFLPLKQTILPLNPDDGPMRFLPALNGILGGVVFLDGLLRHRQGSEMVWIAAVPSIMWGAIWIARSWANSIDLDGLEKLKYNYKGA